MIRGWTAVVLCGMVAGGWSGPVEAQLDAAQRARVGEAIGLIQQGKPGEAETILAGIVEAAPEAPVAWLQLGVARQQLKKFAAAREAYGQARRFPATASTAAYNLGCLCAVQGQTDEAIRHLETARSEGFGDRGQFLADADLDSLRNDPRFASLVPPLLEGPELFAEPVRILLTLNGENANDEFGWIARRLADLDGDGARDFVATAPGFGGHSGKAYVYSSRTGRLLFARQGEPGSRFGNCGGDAGDVNADGTGDVLVGAPQTGKGYLEVLSGRDGTVIWKLAGDTVGDQFGYKAATLGDLNGDGHADFVVTAPQAGGKGSVRAFSGKDGTSLFDLWGEAAGDQFGSAVAGDCSGEDRWLAVGAQDAGDGDRGEVCLYRLESGQPVLAQRFVNDETGANLGQMFLSFPGDLNEDGTSDLYCSDFNSSQSGPGSGRAFVYSGADGALLRDLPGAQPGEGLGTSPSDAGDLDGDGVGDLAIGAWQNREQAISGGKVYLFSGKTGKPIGAWTCRQQGDTFGFDATGLGDVDADGTADLLLTSAWSPVVGPKTGRVFVVGGTR